MVLIKFLLLSLSVFIGLIFGYVLTETRYRIANIPAFNVKPFTCKKCLSFHISWFTAACFSLYLEDFKMLAVGFLFSFILFVGLVIDERERTISINDFDKIK